MKQFKILNLLLAGLILDTYILHAVPAHDAFFGFLLLLLLSFLHSENFLFACCVERSGRLVIFELPQSY